MTPTSTHQPPTQAFGYWTGKRIGLAEELYANATLELGCGDTENAVQCLVSMSTDDLQAFAGARTSFHGGGALPWAPVVDGVQLEKHPLTLLDEGRAARVPILLGFNRDEGAMFEKETSLTGTMQQVLEQWKMSGFNEAERYQMWVLRDE